jgi:hypothetical protein
MHTTKDEEGSINIVLLRNNICSSCNWLEGGGRIIYGVSMGKKGKNENLVCKATKFKSTQDNFKYFEVLVIIGIVGSDIDSSCFMFMEHFL